jgi:hypothetical protein
VLRNLAVAHGTAIPSVGVFVSFVSIGARAGESAARRGYPRGRRCGATGAMPTLPTLTLAFVGRAARDRCIAPRSR